MLGHDGQSNREKSPKQASPRLASNIWALDKDTGIKAMLLVLAHHLGDASFAISNDIVASHQAIYIEHPERSAHRVYLYNYGQSSGLFGAHLEYPDNPAHPNDATNPNATAQINVYTEFEGLSVAQVTQMISAHFNIVQ